MLAYLSLAVAFQPGASGRVPGASGNILNKFTTVVYGMRPRVALLDDGVVSPLWTPPPFDQHFGKVSGGELVWDSGIWGLQVFWS